MSATTMTKAVTRPSPERRIMVGCLAVSGAGVACSLGLALLPIVGWQLDAASPLQLLPTLSATVALAGGGMCLVASRRTQAEVSPPAPVATDLPAATISGLQKVVRELGSLLAEERSRVATLQEVCNAGLRDARTVSTRVQNLADAALEAETRLAAGVTKAGEAAMHVSNALPEIAGMVRRGITDALAERLKAEADTSLQVLRTALSEAAGQIAELGETAAAVRRNVTGLDSAGKGIAAASDEIITRLGGAVGQIETAAALLPPAATRVVAAAEQAAAGMAASAEQAGALLDQTAARVGEAVDGAREQAATRLADVTQQTTRALAQVAEELRADAGSLGGGARETQQAAADLRQSAGLLETANTRLTARIESAADQINSATTILPEAIAAMRTTADQAARHIVEAADSLSGEATGLNMAANELRATTEELRTGGRTVEAAGAKLVTIVTEAVAHVDAVLAEVPPAVSAITTAASEAAWQVQGTAGGLREDGAAITAAAQEVQAMLRQKAESLHDASVALRDDGLALAGSVRDTQALLQTQAKTLQAAGEALADSGQQAAAGLTDAAGAVSTQLAAMTSAADQIKRASNTAAHAIVGIEARAGEALASLDGAGAALQQQVGRLEAATRQAESLAGSNAMRLAEALRLVETRGSALPEAAERLDRAAARLAELDALSARLERLVGGQEQAATLADLSGDIGQSVRRVEAVLADHQEIWPALQSSVAQVQAAAVAVVEATAKERARSSFAVEPEGAPEALATTLRQFDELDAQSQGLLRQTEALAEAVLAGRAPGVPPLLASRAPELLAGIEATTRRLRSVATALALASDGMPVGTRAVA